MAAVIPRRSPAALDAVDSSAVFRRQMLADLANTQRRVTAAGVETSYYEFGEGPPLVLLHGAIECGGVMWSPVVPALARRYRVIVPDVPGLGESAALDRLDPDTFGRWLTSFLAAINVQRPILVAHSLVGALALRFAVSNYRDLRRLVAYAGPGIGKYRLPLRLMYVAVRLQLRPTPKNDERFARFALLDYEATRASDVDWFDAFAAYSLRLGVTSRVKRTMNTLIRTCTKRIPDEELRQIEVPVDLLWGEGDRISPISLGKGASQRLGWPLHVIPRAAHAPHIEQPEAFVETLLSILDSPVPADVMPADTNPAGPNGQAVSQQERKST